jgi:hypothetical protein
MNRAPMEVELDSRHRLPMAKVVHTGQHRFRVTPLRGGDFLLSPVESISARELAMLRNPEALASLQEGVRQAAEGETTRYDPGHFQRLAEELGPDDEDAEA